MKNLFKIISSTIIMLALSFTLHAQNLPEVGSLGLRASILGQNTIEVPYMLNESVSIAPVVGFSFGDGIVSTVQIGVGTRFYQQSSGSLSPYISGNLLGTLIDDNLRIMLGGGYGGEYFFSNNFSLSAEGLVNLYTGSGATTLSTGARISASVYF